MGMKTIRSRPWASPERSNTRALGLALCLFTLSIAAQAQQNGRWTLLGDTNVSGQADHVRILVTERRVTFRAMRIRVRNAGIELNKAVVRYGEDQAVSIDIGSQIPAGGETAVIHIPPHKGRIQSVEIWYRPEPWTSAHPKVRLFGMY